MPLSLASASRTHPCMPPALGARVAQCSSLLQSWEPMALGVMRRHGGMGDKHAALTPLPARARPRRPPHLLPAPLAPSAVASRRGPCEPRLHDGILATSLFCPSGVRSYSAHLHHALPTQGHTLRSLAVGAALRDDLHQPCVLLLLLVRLVHGTFEFAQPLAQTFGNIGNVLTAKEKDGDKQNQHDLLHP